MARDLTKMEAQLCDAERAFAHTARERGLAKVAASTLSGLRTSCPQKQGTRELPRKFLITF